MAGNEYFCKNERRLFFLYKTRRLSQWLYMAISIDDIKDKESLEAWLNERPEAVRQNCAVFIAARSALRVLPVAVDGFQFVNWPLNSSLTAIPILRGVFISSVAAKIPIDDLGDTSFASAAAGVAFTASVSYAYINVAISASLALGVAVAFDASAAADAVFLPAKPSDNPDASTGDTVHLLNQVRSDCRAWLDHAKPDGTCGIDVAALNAGEMGIKPDWPVVREKLLNDTDPDRGADWSFWVAWYDKILRGDAQDWELLYEIAVSQEIDWEASPREVNEAIARIVEKLGSPSLRKLNKKIVI
jgi:hypothetical protein